MSRREVRVTLRVSEDTYKLIESLSDELNIDVKLLLKEVVSIVSDYLDMVTVFSDEFMFASKSKYRRFALALDEILKLGSISKEFMDFFKSKLWGIDGFLLEDMGWSEDLNSVWLYFTVSSKRFKWIDDLYIEFRNDGSLSYEISMLVSLTEYLGERLGEVVRKLEEVTERAKGWDSYRKVKRGNECGGHKISLGIEKDEFSINLILYGEAPKWSCLPNLKAVNSLFRSVAVKAGVKEFRLKSIK